MAPAFSRFLYIDIDQEWAQSLKGLKVKVPSGWWQGCDGNELNAGAIAAVDFSKSNQRYFQFLLDSDRDETEDEADLPALYYSMRYDAVFLYADETQPHYSHFQLPRCPVPTADGEQVH